MIVEDQPFVGMVASDILRESGFETFHAYDATDATAVLEAHPEIEVVVTEAQLPGDVTGIELCRRLSQQRPDLQLVVTATAPEQHASAVPRARECSASPMPAANSGRSPAASRCSSSMPKLLAVLFV